MFATGLSESSAELRVVLTDSQGIVLHKNAEVPQGVLVHFKRVDGPAGTIGDDNDQARMWNAGNDTLNQLEPLFLAVDIVEGLVGNLVDRRAFDGRPVLFQPLIQFEDLLESAEADRSEPLHFPWGLSFH